MRRIYHRYTYLIVVFLLMAIGLVIFQIIRRRNIEKIHRFSKIIEQENIQRYNGYKIQSYKNLNLGNIIAYPNNVIFNEPLIIELAYEKYGVFISSATREGELEVVKPIMDSVIFLRYGRDFYNKLLREADSIEKNISQNMTIDGYHLIVNKNFDDIETTKRYVLNRLKVSKLIPFKQNPFYPRRLIVDFVVDKNGDIRNVRDILHYNQKIDSVVINLLRTLPFKWTPGSVDGRIVEFREEIIFEFGRDPFYKKID